MHRYAGGIGIARDRAVDERVAFREIETIEHHLCLAAPLAIARPLEANRHRALDECDVFAATRHLGVTQRERAQAEVVATFNRNRDRSLAGRETPGPVRVGECEPRAARRG